jgi:threonine dehydratase
MSDALPTFDDVRAAADRLAGRILRTPLIRHRLLDEIAGAVCMP